ncbi:MAG TPA: hypothetical protein VG898_04400 [Solirubrobacterales bacterium]|nr:hypothetical protein [Solirubrobacterales bacterium]
MSDGRLRVLYCDDQESFRKEFLTRHRDHFEIETTDDIAGVLPTLLNRRHEELPDLLLLDLYHDIDPANDDDGRDDRVKAAKAALEELDESVQRARSKVDLAWRPVAVEVAEGIRRHFPMHDLPIMIYSQKGLFFLDDEQMRRIEAAEVDWLLKDSDRFTAVTEDVRIRRVVQRSKASKRVPRDVRIAIWSVTAGLVGSALTLAIQALVT